MQRYATCVIACYLGGISLTIGTVALAQPVAVPVSNCKSPDSLAVVGAENLPELQTPAVYIDYVMMPDSFVMDTIIDIPFNLGLFFSDVETLTTVDWRNAPDLPELTIRSPDTTSGLVVNGQMPDRKQQFNTISGTRFSVHSAYGSIFIKLDIPDGVPIQPWLYLNDQLDVADPPEKQPGQFGNVGYRTTGWEHIDTEVHHVKFTTCMTAAEVERGS